MNVYFACSSSHLEPHLPEYQNITRLIKSHGHRIPHDWLGHVTKRSLTEIQDVSIKRQQLREEGIEALKAVDVMVAEVSFPSLGVGYQIGKALNNKKPVLCLYSEEFGQKGISQVIDSSSSPLLTTKVYSQKNLDKILIDFFKHAKKRNLIKFNFIITPEIEEYLNWVSENGKWSKSEVLREKVNQNIISKDLEYLKFLTQKR